MINLKSINKFVTYKANAPAFVDDEKTLTWGGLKAETEKKIIFLTNHYGRELPQQICYIARNCMELIPWLSACATLGIPIVGLDYTLPIESLKKLTEKAQADLLLVASNLFAKDTNITTLAPPQAMVLDIDSVTQSFLGGETIPGEIDLLDYIAQLNLPQKPFRAIGFTSGTASLPKVVVRTQSFDQRRFAYFSENYNFSDKDKFFLSMPLYHAAGNGWARLFSSLGATVFFTKSDSSLDIALSMREHAVTASVMTPVMLSSLLDHIDISPADYCPKSLRWLLIGGKHCPSALKKRALETLGACLYEYYGTTETGVNTIAEPNDIAHFPESVGKAYDGNSIAIINDQGTHLPPLTVGSVAVASYMNMAFYLNESSKEVELNGERYLVTAEQGYLDAQGRLFLLNRANHNAHLYRLEDAIRTLPCVTDVAIVCGKKAGELYIDCALKVKRVGNNIGLIERVEQLAKQENVIFSRCRILPSIPYSPSGKVRVTDMEALMAL